MSISDQWEDDVEWHKTGNQFAGYKYSSGKMLMDKKYPYYLKFTFKNATPFFCMNTDQPD